MPRRKLKFKVGDRVELTSYGRTLGKDVGDGIALRAKYGVISAAQYIDESSYPYDVLWGPNARSSKVVTGYYERELQLSLGQALLQE